MMRTQRGQALFTVTSMYVAWALLQYAFVAVWLLMPFLIDIGLRSGWAVGAVLVAEMLGLVLLIRRLANCGIFAVTAGIELTTVTRTTFIPFSRFRIYENRASFVGKVDMVPVLADTNGRAVKAGVMTGMDPAERLRIVRTILHTRDVATSDNGLN